MARRCLVARPVPPPPGAHPPLPDAGTGRNSTLLISNAFTSQRGVPRRKPDPTYPLAGRPTARLCTLRRFQKSYEPPRATAYAVVNRRQPPPGRQELCPDDSSVRSDCLRQRWSCRRPERGIRCTLRFARPRTGANPWPSSANGGRGEPQRGNRPPPPDQTDGPRGKTGGRVDARRGLGPARAHRAGSIRRRAPWEGPAWS